MRRVLTASVIILFVIVTGISALVMLVDPNEFRQEIAEQIEQNSGYQLTIESPLRWHVWPKLSILTGRVTLSVPGAKLPMISADNMRIDVAFIPLLLHKLSIKYLLFKGAVIRIMPESSEQGSLLKPKAPKETVDSYQNLLYNWPKFFQQVDLLDSLLIWQKSTYEQINVRDLNLSLKYIQPNTIAFTLNNRIDRNQRELLTSLSGIATVSEDTQIWDIERGKLHYSLRGAGLPTFLKGHADLHILYQTNRFVKIKIDELHTNNTVFKGIMDLELHPFTTIQANLTTERLNLDQFDFTPATIVSSAQKKGMGVQKTVIIGDNISTIFTELKNFNFNISLFVRQLIGENWHFNNFRLNLKQAKDSLYLTSVFNDKSMGKASLNGELSINKGKYNIKLTPAMSDFDLDDLPTNTTSLSRFFTGKLSLNGDLQYSGFPFPSTLLGWEGNIKLDIHKPLLKEFNIPRLIAHSMGFLNYENNSDFSMMHQTSLEKLTARLQLFHDGQIKIAQIAASSDKLNLVGDGTLNIVNRQCDLTLDATMVGEWDKSTYPDLWSSLHGIPVPIYIHGSWDKLSYRVGIDKLILKKLKKQKYFQVKEWLDK